jgi:hypothetical protein
MNLLEESARDLPIPPIGFALIAFGVLTLLLYLTLRIDRD